MLPYLNNPGYTLRKRIHVLRPKKKKADNKNPKIFAHVFVSVLDSNCDKCSLGFALHCGWRCTMVLGMNRTKLQLEEYYRKHFFGKKIARASSKTKEYAFRFPKRYYSEEYAGAKMACANAKVLRDFHIRQRLASEKERLKREGPVLHNRFKKNAPGSRYTKVCCVNETMLLL